MVGFFVFVSGADFLPRYHYTPRSQQHITAEQLFHQVADVWLPPSFWPDATKSKSSWTVFPRSDPGQLICRPPSLFLHFCANQNIKMSEPGRDVCLSFSLDSGRSPLASRVSPASKSASQLQLFAGFRCFFLFVCLFWRKERPNSFKRTGSRQCPRVGYRHSDKSSVLAWKHDIRTLSRHVGPGGQVRFAYSSRSTADKHTQK